MPPVSLNKVKALPDLISNERFEFILGNHPGQTDDNLHIKCVDVGLAGRKTEPIVVNLWGHQVKHRGKKESSQQIPVTFLEDMRMRTYSALRSWSSAVVRGSTGASVGPKSDYSVEAELRIFDHAGRLASTTKYYNVFVEELEKVQLSGEQSELMRVTATFAYDFSELIGIDN